MAARRTGRGRRILLFLLLILAIPFVIDALVETDEERIARLIDDSIERVEQKDAAGIADLVSEHFEDDSGKLKALMREGAEGAIAAFLSPWEDIEIELHSLEIAVDGDRAEIHLDCGVLALPTGKIPFLSSGSREGKRLPMRVTLRAVLGREMSAQGDAEVWRYRELKELEPRVGL